MIKIQMITRYYCTQLYINTAGQPGRTRYITNHIILLKPIPAETETRSLTKRLNQ